MSVREQEVKKILEERELNHGDFYQNFLTIGKIWGALHDKRAIADIAMEELK